MLSLEIIDTITNLKEEVLLQILKLSRITFQSNDKPLNIFRGHLSIDLSSNRQDSTDSLNNARQSISSLFQGS
jgi:hypothetical protein